MVTPSPAVTQGRPRRRMVAAVSAPRIRRWAVVLIGWGALLVLLGAGLVWSYRAAPVFDLDLGSRDAEPFISGFHAPERTPAGDLTYRWTTGRASVRAPGFGRRDAVVTLSLAGTGRGDAPLPSVSVVVAGTEVASLAATAAVQAYVVPVPASLVQAGDLVVALQTSEFRAPNDSRRLGVLVDAVRIEAADQTAALPPWRYGLLAGAAVTAVAVIAFTTLGVGWPALALTTAVTLALVAGSRYDRFTWALWFVDGVPLVLATGLIVLGGLGATWLWRWQARERWSSTAVQDATQPSAPAGRLTATGVTTHTPRDGHASLLWLILWTVGLAQVLGVAHPQFRSSDLTMNVHRLEDVARGTWLFTLALPGPSALPAPYPPAFYALLLPFLPLVDHDFGQKQALVTHASAALIVALSACAYLVAARIAGPAAGLWAALLHGFAPAGFLLVSQGNFANVFGQAAAGVLLALLALLPDWRRPVAALALVSALLLAMLGHFGVFLSLLVAVPAIIVFVASLPPSGRRQALTLTGLFGLALLLAIALYYRHYAGLIATVAQRVADARASGDGTALGWNAGLAIEGRRLVEALGWLALPLTLVGLPWLWRGLQAGRATLGWLSAAALFGVVGLVLGLSVRYQFFGLLGIAIAGGVALAWLAKRGRVGLGVALVAACVWVGGGLAFWYTRILTYLH